MKRKLLPLVLVFAINIPVLADAQEAPDTTEKHQWDKTEKVLFGIHVGLSAIDMIQAYKGLEHDNIRELNPLVNATGPKWLPVHFIVLRVGLTWWALNELPSGKLRKRLLYFLDIVDTSVVLHNHQVLKRAGIRY